MNSNNLLVNNIKFLKKHKAKLQQILIIVNMDQEAILPSEYLYLWQKEFKLYMVLIYMAIKTITIRFKTLKILRI